MYDGQNGVCFDAHISKIAHSRSVIVIPTIIPSESHTGPFLISTNIFWALFMSLFKIRFLSPTITTTVIYHGSALCERTNEHISQNVHCDPFVIRNNYPQTLISWRAVRTRGAERRETLEKINPGSRRLAFLLRKWTLNNEPCPGRRKLMRRGWCRLPDSSFAWRSAASAAASFMDTVGE